MEKIDFYTLVIYWIAAGMLIFPVLLKFRAPYGRYTDKKWGFPINNRLGWFIMELPAAAVFPMIFILGTGEKSIVIWIFLAFWAAHYINRDFIFPWQLKTSKKKMPIAIVLFAIIFNSVNGSVTGYFFGYLSPLYEISWLYDPRFITGVLIFISGMYINTRADKILLKLRKPGETGYKIPQGFLYRWISCPNYFGEIIEWAGFALMTWCLPTLSFSIWTTINLLPRALSHHKWYRENFNNYPEDRKAIIPFIL